MDFSKLSVIFKFIIMAIVYIIIFVALVIMYKDIKNGGKKKTRKKSLGLEVVDSGQNSILRKGSVIPIHGELTVGRRSSNLLVLDDQYVSGNHAKVYLKNTDYVLEDLESTNGTYFNSKRLEGKTILRAGDEIKIGSAVFKVIG